MRVSIGTSGAGRRGGRGDHSAVMKGRRSERRGGPSSLRFRSRSPFMRDDKRRCRPQERPYMSSGRQSAASAERRQDYRHVNELVHDHLTERRQDYRHVNELVNDHLTERRQDYRHVNELVHDHLTPPQCRHRSRSPPHGFRMQQEIMLPASNRTWKPSNSIKDTGFHSEIVDALPPSSGDIEMHGLLLKRSNVMEEGHSPSLQYRHRSLSPPTFSLCNKGIKLQPKSVLPASNPTLKPSHSIKDRDFHYQIDEALPPSSVDIVRHRLLLKKSKLMEEGHSPPPQHRHRFPSPPPFPLCSDGFRLQHKSVLPASKPTLKPCHLNEDRDFHHKIVEALPPSSVDIERHGLLLKKSNLMEEGPSRSFYSDHSMMSNVLGCERLRLGGRSFGMGIEDCEMHCYRNRHRYQHDDMNREHVYSKDLSFPEMPPSHLRPVSSTISSNILTEDLKGAHHDHASDGLDARVIRHPNDPLEFSAYNQVPLPDSSRHGLPDESRKYDYDEIHMRGLDDHRHQVADELYERMPSVSQSEFRDATCSSVLGYAGDYMDKADASNRNRIERVFSRHHHSLHREADPDYHDVMAQEEELLNSSDCRRSGLLMKSSRAYENMPLEEDFSFENDLIPLSSRVEHRTRRSWFSDHDLDEHRLAISTHDRTHLDDLSDYEQEKMRQENYTIDGDMDEMESRIMFMNDRNSFLAGGDEEIWPSEEPTGFSLSKSVMLEHSRYRTFSRSIPRSDALMPSSCASSMHAENNHDIRLKGKMKHRHSGFRNSSFSERRQDLLGSYKYCKRGLHDRLGVQGRRTDDSGAHFVKNDPPKGSAEFKQQVHKAFLRFSKLLNESPSQQLLHHDQGNTNSLICCVCGSSSKQFVDTHSLVTHMYHSLKAGLKTEHLGFHKALCLFLGWNWRIPPENSRAYQSIPFAEVKTLREDLILWPPLVIIHDISVGGESSTKAGKVQTIEDMKKIIRDMGFGVGLSQICPGKLANHSIFTVKYMPMFSALQEAERLHRHFASKMRGKHDLQQNISRGFSSQNKAECQFVEVDEILYGYMAVAEDLDKLNPETKKRSVVKSRKDIEAIADAPLNTD